MTFHFLKIHSFTEIPNRGKGRQRPMKDKYSAIHKQMNLFIYLGFYVAFNTVQVISRWVVGRAEETSTYSSLGFCTVNCRPAASNYQLFHLRPCRDRTLASEVGGESITTLPPWPPHKQMNINVYI